VMKREENVSRPSLSKVSALPERVPLILNMAVLVPIPSDIPYLSLLTVTDRENQRGRLEDAPVESLFKKGQLVEYGWLPGFRYPWVINGFGPA